MDVRPDQVNRDGKPRHEQLPAKLMIREWCGASKTEVNDVD